MKLISESYEIQSVCESDLSEREVVVRDKKDVLEYFEINKEMFDAVHYDQIVKIVSECELLREDDCGRLIAS